MQLVSSSDPILRQVCRSDFRVGASTIAEMFELLKSLGGLGLAAPQVGIDARLFVTAWGEIFVNPKFHDCWDSTEVVEGCLSFPGLQVKKKRWLNVRLKDGSAYTGRWAITLQHEMAHLDGICIG